MANRSEPVELVGPPRLDVGGVPAPPRGGKGRFPAAAVDVACGVGLGEAVATGVGSRSVAAGVLGRAVGPGVAVAVCAGCGVPVVRGVGLGVAGGVAVGRGVAVGAGLGVGVGVGVGCGDGVGCGVGVACGVAVGFGVGVGVGVGVPFTTAIETEALSIPDVQVAWSRDSAGQLYVPTGVPVTRTWKTTTSPSALRMSASVTAWTQMIVDPDGPAAGASAVQACGAASTATALTLNALPIWSRMQPTELPPLVFVAVIETLAATPSTTDEGDGVMVQPPLAASTTPEPQNSTSSWSDAMNGHHLVTPRRCPIIAHATWSVAARICPVTTSMPGSGASASFRMPSTKQLTNLSSSCVPAASSMRRNASSTLIALR
jgi:hypothetical protein